mmetsp:Transcript_89204/g.230233  ORF Transcript_89204/g.230233 Transcript_89204/m.230233 type:complete len:233 (+) Transcript_89204:161-859(+)
MKALRAGCDRSAAGAAIVILLPTRRGDRGARCCGLERGVLGLGRLLFPPGLPRHRRLRGHLCKMQLQAAGVELVHTLSVFPRRVVAPARNHALWHRRSELPLGQQVIRDWPMLTKRWISNQRVDLRSKVGGMLEESALVAIILNNSIPAVPIIERRLCPMFVSHEVLRAKLRTKSLGVAHRVRGLYSYEERCLRPFDVAVHGLRRAQAILGDERHFALQDQRCENVVKLTQP